MVPSNARPPNGDYIGAPLAASHATLVAEQNLLSWPSDAIRLVFPGALSDPEKLFGAYSNSPTVGLCILDSNFRFLAINDRLAEMNGVPAPDHLGRTVRQVLGDFADLVEPEFQRVLSAGETVLNFQVSALLPTRTEVGYWIEHFLPIKDDAGAVTRIGVVAVELTEQKKLEQSLHNVNTRLRQERERFQILADVGNILASNWNVPQVFPSISARIRRVLRQEYASLELHDAGRGLLVRQAEDFPLGKGLLSAVEISAHNSPGGRSLQARLPMIFSREQIQSFQVEIARRLLDEGLQSLCCVPLVRPKEAFGVLVLGSTRAGAFHPDDLNLLNQVAAQCAVAMENHRAAVEIEALKQRLDEEGRCLQGEFRAEAPFAEIIGVSPTLKQALDQAATVATSDATVLILGETGTGKELIARAIHRMSRRHDGPFIKINCAAIPTGLLESELFGHERGAFTGAISQKIGRMELAHDGTLFLDEVGDIPLELQAKLLRALQDQEFERLGSTRTIKVNLRVVAATNRDLAQSVAESEFRSDLFYRLSVFPIHMPALRERREDIPLLVRHFVRKFAPRMERHIETVPKETMIALTEWAWPGNVRELENLVERSVILSQGRVLRVPLAGLRRNQPPALASPDQTLDRAEREHIIRVLRETAGVISGSNGAAARLGLKRTTLQSKMQRLKIARQDYSGSQKS
ncbi:MAG TPA: sigma 54-interacting transcriptional regulator [Candidatus Sulfotelmatobacter sp.]|nr:sigma 54-interacting transcriptional regulator [Candidatus Sulfotelmatobacter sp.]